MSESVVRRAAKRWAVAIVALALGATSACSIEGSRQRNESCLQTRECTAGLVCAPDTSSGDNRLRCTDTLDGTIPIADTATPPRDTAAPPTDAPATE